MANRQKLINMAAFLVFGSMVATQSSLVYVASEDLLAQTNIPSTFVIIADKLPHVCVAILGPYLIDRFSYWCKTIAVTITYVTAILLMAFPSQVEWKLTGVAMNSLSKGLGEFTFLPLTALHGGLSVSAYFTGTGIGYFMAPLYYTVATVFANVSPRTAIAIIAVFPLLLPIMYYLLTKNENQTDTMVTEYKTIPYSPLTSEDESLKLKLSCKDKLYLMWTNLEQFRANFNSMFCRYVIAFSVMTTMVFPEAGFGPRNHYVIYTLFMSFGQLIGRSYALLFKCIKSDMNPYTRHTWLMSAFLEASLIFLVFASWYSFLPSVWIVVAFSFLVGTLNGMIYLNCVAVAGGTKNQSKIKVEFSRAYMASSSNMGAFVASILGLMIEPILIDHCKQITGIAELCFTRDVSSLE